MVVKVVVNTVACIDMSSDVLRCDLSKFVVMCKMDVLRLRGRTVLREWMEEREEESRKAAPSRNKSGFDCNVPLSRRRLPIIYERLNSDKSKTRSILVYLFYLSTFSIYS